MTTSHSQIEEMEQMSERDFFMVYLPHDTIDERWDRVMELIRKGIHRDAYSPNVEPVVARVMSGDTALFLIHDDLDNIVGAMGIEIKRTDRGPLTEIAWLAGERFDEWWDFALDNVEKIAKELDSYAVKANCRRGFKKYLEPRGFREQSVSLFKFYKDLH